MNDLQEQEKELQQYMLQLEKAEAARVSLLSQLKDALQEQVQMFLQSLLYSWAVIVNKLLYNWRLLTDVKFFRNQGRSLLALSY